MSSYKIRQIFERSYDGYSAQHPCQPDVQRKAAHAILNGKSGKLKSVYRLRTPLLPCCVYASPPVESSHLLQSKAFVRPFPQMLR